MPTEAEPGLSPPDCRFIPSLNVREQVVKVIIAGRLIAYKGKRVANG